MNTFIPYRTYHRLILRTVLAVMFCVGLTSALLITLPAHAQTDNQEITVGDIVTGTLDSQNLVRIYTLTASAGDTITVDITTSVDTLAPIVIITDQRGNVIIQDADINTPTTATITDLELPTTGTYYIIVMRGSGAMDAASGTFTLHLGGFQQVGGQSLTLTEGGIVFELVWDAPVNLNLEIRDPVGGTVQHLSPGSPSGGTLDADINANCNAAVATQPTETIAWPAGTVPAGSYEVIIYYADSCSVGGPQLFTLNASINDETSQTLIGTLNPGQEYLARLTLDPGGAWRLVNGGVNAGLDVSLFRDEITQADPIALGSTVSGVITNNAPAQAYTFNAQANTIVNIRLAAQTGSLDTYLVLLGPDNIPLESNDDADDESTDSALSRTLALDGTYTVLVTRYGLTIGGTEGEYNLTLTSAEVDTVTSDETATTDGEESAALPQGAIEIKLEWATLADLQLLVRDPQGNTVYDDKDVVSSGGILERAGNIRCEEPTNTPVSYIYWPTDRPLTPGVYEIDVWYQSQCNDTTPVNFGLSVVAQDQMIINTSSPLELDNNYVITFTIEEDGSVVAGLGGYFDSTNPSSLNFTTQLATANEISYGQTVSGRIDDQQRFVIYTFEGMIGDIITLGMDTSGGTLDTLLYLVSPEQTILAYHDDITPGDNSNSVIDQITLPSTGMYYIVATRYGLNVGGTQGTFNLTLVHN